MKSYLHWMYLPGSLSGRSRSNRPGICTSDPSLWPLALVGITLHTNMCNYACVPGMSKFLVLIGFYLPCNWEIGAGCYFVMLLLVSPLRFHLLSWPLYFGSFRPDHCYTLYFSITKYGNLFLRSVLSYFVSFTMMTMISMTVDDVHWECQSNIVYLSSSASTVTKNRSFQQSCLIISWTNVSPFRNTPRWHHVITPDEPPTWIEL